MQLFQFPFSHNCAKVKITLLEKGLDFETPVVDAALLRSSAFRTMSPLGKVPLLVDGDLMLSESEVIVEYLEDKYPQVPMLPASVEGRARSRWLSRFHDMYLGPQLSTLYFALSDGRAGKPEFAAEVDRLFELIALLEGVIDPQPYLLGSQFTLADAPYALSYHFVVTLSAAHGRPLTEAGMPKLAKWYAAASARPSVAAVLEAAKVALAGG